MDGKLESRQSQFPASFPDTFKNFFAIMNEDEDQMELFPNLLEDKVIPRKNQFQQRVCGGSLRCSMHPRHRRQTIESDIVHKIGVTGLKVNTATQNNVGRSNSFRFNRPRHNTVSSSSSVLNNLGRPIGVCKSFIDSEIDNANGILNSSKFGGSGSYLFCKHMKYCCLHQQQQRKNELQQQQQQPRSHSQSENYDNHLMFQQQPTVLQSLETRQQKQQDFFSKNFNYDCNNIRLGPDGEDNKTAAINIKNAQIYHNPNYQESHPFYQESNYAPETMMRQYKCPSVKLEQAFDFDISCKECDSISSISATPLEMVATQQQQSHNVLKPILKQPQKNHHQHNQLQAMSNNEQKKVPKSILKDTKQQKQHRTLPHPPIDAGLGVFHTKEAALQRVQQQSGLLSIGNITTTSIAAASAIGATTIKSTEIEPITAEKVEGITTITNENVLQKPLNSKNYYQTYNNNTNNKNNNSKDYNNSNNSNSNNTNSSIGSDRINGIGNNNSTNMKNTGENRNICILNRNAALQNVPTVIGDAHANADYTTIILQSDMNRLDADTKDIYINKPNCMESVNSTNSEKTDINRAVTFTQNDFHKNLQKPLTRINNKSNIFSNYPLNKNNSNTSIEFRGNMASMPEKKSPILNRSRSSSIAANFSIDELNYKHCHSSLSRAITASSLTVGPVNQAMNIDTFYNANNVLQQKREYNNITVSRCSNKSSRLNMMPLDSSGVLTFQQAISGAVSPQYLAKYNCNCNGILAKSNSNFIKNIQTQRNISLVDDNTMSTDTNLLSEDNGLLEKQTKATVTATTTATAVSIKTTTTTTTASTTTSKLTKSSLLLTAAPSLPVINSSTETDDIESLNSPIILQERRAGVGSSALVHGASTTTMAPTLNKQVQKPRMRTSSMPAENRKPRLVDTRRAAIHCADLDLEYYRLRSFSITSHGVCNLGDSVRSRRSRSITSVTSTATSNSGKDRHNSNASRTSGDLVLEKIENFGNKNNNECKTTIPGYKIAILGAAGVGKTTLTYQFTTSEYICAYDLSLDDDYGQKTVSVLVDGIETDLEIIDHPACEMSTEAFCSTYNLDLFVVVYSVVDRNSFKIAEKILQYLKENEMLLTRGAILVGNKTDLERHREVNRQMARKLATDVACKFIETSSGLDHNVDELLVGIVAQVKLNPQRIKNLSENVRQRLKLQNTIQKPQRSYASHARLMRQMSMSETDNIDHNNGDVEYACDDENQDNNITVMPNGTDGTMGSASERTVSTTLSSSGDGINNQALSCTKSTNMKSGRKMTKRPLNLESILKMGESEFEDEEEVQLPITNVNKKYGESSQSFSKFELLKSDLKSNNNFCSLQLVNHSLELEHNIKRRNTKIQFTNGSDDQEQCYDVTVQQASAVDSFPTSSENILTDNCNKKALAKLTSRTKTFLTSVLRFKKALNVAKRRNSSSCSDLFVI